MCCCDSTFYGAFITGFGIGAAALKNITSGDYNNIVVPGILALVAAIVSIVSKGSYVLVYKI